jgi:phosphoglycerate dehydrogenase-like enzyme
VKSRAGCASDTYYFVTLNITFCRSSSRDEFPNMISARDFEAMLKQQAPVHGVALGGTRFGEPELEASGNMKVVTRIGVGFDAVDVPALSRRKVPRWSPAPPTRPRSPNRRCS